MDVQGLIDAFVSATRDISGPEYLFRDEEIVDVYANAARDKLFLLTRNMIIDSTTAEDDADPANPLCEIDIIAGTGSYSYSPKIIKVLDVYLASQTAPLPRVFAASLRLNTQTRHWRSLDAGTPVCWCPDLDSDKIRLIPAPSANDTAYLTVSRFPLTRLSYLEPTASLGFREEYHDDLLPWMLHLAFSKKDAETDKPELSAFYRRKFEDRCKVIKVELCRRSI